MHGVQTPFTTGSSTSGPAMPSNAVRVHASPLAGARQAQPHSSDFANASSPARVKEASTITVHSSQPQKPAGQSMSSSGTVFQDTGSVELAQLTVAGTVVAAETLATQTTASAGSGWGGASCCKEFSQCCEAGCQLCGSVLSGLGHCLFCLLTCCCPSD